jgi:FAD/FMN-containing dehydrogenase
MQTYQPTTAFGQVNGDLLEKFQSDFGGNLIGRDHQEFDHERILWNKFHNKQPGMIAQCTGVHDVIEAVNYARSNNMLVSVRGGGHNVAGNALIDDGLIIDLSRMRTVLVDPMNKTAIVQGGATWGDVDRETQTFGLACAGGVVSDTGVGGLTLGGGLSWLRRKVGMSIDNLLGVDIVLADGSFVHASDKAHQDLFWALKGGGGNFGIATSFHFRLHDLGPNVMMAACLYPRSEAEKIMEFWIDYTRDLQDEITSDCINWAIPEHPAFPEEIHGTKVTGLAGMYFGPAEEGEKVLRPLREVAEPFLDLSGIMPFTTVNKMFDPFLEKATLNSYWKCLYVNDIDDKLMQVILDKVNAVPSKEALLSIRNLQGQIANVSSDATAFGDRSARFLVSIDTMWRDESMNEECIEYTRDFYEAVAAYSNGQVYYNFDSDMDGKGCANRQSFGDNFERLAKIKARYDPDNFFRMNANIKPAEVVD